MSKQMTEDSNARAPVGNGRHSVARWVCAGLCVVAFLVSFRYALDQRRSADIRMDGGNRVRGLARSCWLHASTHDGAYPALASPDQMFSIGPAQIRPPLVVGGKLKRPLEDPYAAILVRPHDAYRAYALESLAEDPRYFYLGYAVTSETEGLALLGAVRERVARGLPLTEDIPAPAGQGTWKGDTFLRLCTAEAIPPGSAIQDEGMWERVATVIPLIVEDPGNYDKPGGWVVYLDRQSMFVPFPGPFPMTEEFISQLRDARTRDAGM
ncbi:MAG: hypothetical protein GY851_17995 [bacterium]|nr:hypothetical protein [bacterium]